MEKTSTSVMISSLSISVPWSDHCLLFIPRSLILWEQGQWLGKLLFSSVPCRGSWLAVNTTWRTIFCGWSTLIYFAHSRYPPHSGATEWAWLLSSSLPGDLNCDSGATQKNLLFEVKIKTSAEKHSDQRLCACWVSRSGRWRGWMNLCK